MSNCFAYDFMSDYRFNGSLIKHSNYMVDNDIKNNSNYLPTLWASLLASLTRATNACEFFLSVFKDNFYIWTPLTEP